MLAALTYLLTSLFLLFQFKIWHISGEPPVLELVLAFFVISLAYLKIISKSRYHKTEWSFLIVMAFLSKLILVFAPVMLTGDLPRYVFEGFLLANGYSPYLHAPIEFSANLMPEIWSQIEYKELSAIYPPASLIAFSLFAKSIFSWKLFLFFLEMFNFLVIVKLLGI